MWQLSSFRFKRIENSTEKQTILVTNKFTSFRRDVLKLLLNTRYLFIVARNTTLRDLA